MTSLFREEVSWPTWPCLREEDGSARTPDGEEVDEPLDYKGAAPGKGLDESLSNSETLSCSCHSQHEPAGSHVCLVQLHRLEVGKERETHDDACADDEVVDCAFWREVAVLLAQQSRH